jgi:hypothetical protein
MLCVLAIQYGMYISIVKSQKVNQQQPTLFSKSKKVERGERASER